VFWLVQCLNHFLFKGRLLVLGILPRHPLGLLGVVCSPFLHGDFNHLMVNSLMMLVLGMFVLLSGIKVFCVVTAAIVLLSGLLTWCFGRPYLHVGASGLVMGYWGYCLVQAYSKPSIVTIAIVAACLYYFLGMFANLFPQDKKVSWEGHLFGFIAGIVTVFAEPWLLTLF